MIASTLDKAGCGATPSIGPRDYEIQAFGSVVPVPITLAEDTRREDVANLNQLLADLMSLRDLYNWQASRATFYQLHLLYDKHAGEQTELMDAVAARVTQLGGRSIATAADATEMTLIPRPPKDREAVPAQLRRLLQAHEVVLKEARAMARQTARGGDEGTNDLLVNGVICTNEKQVWFLAEQLIDGSRISPSAAAGL